jgi:hypothetical protein
MHDGVGTTNLCSTHGTMMPRGCAQLRSAATTDQITEVAPRGGSCSATPIRIKKNELFTAPFVLTPSAQSGHRSTIS